MFQDCFVLLEPKSCELLRHFFTPNTGILDDRSQTGIADSQLSGCVVLRLANKRIPFANPGPDAVNNRLFFLDDRPRSDHLVAVNFFAYKPAPALECPLKFTWAGWSRSI